MSSLFMETAEISPERTISEIEGHLISHGAAAVLKEYTGGAIEAVSFKMRTPAGDLPFRLPCRWQAIETILTKKARGKWNYSLSNDQKFRIREKSKRVAWRQILRWILAQMALVETCMVTVEEVFFPYIQAPSGQTLYELQAEKHFGLLEAPKQER